MEKSQKKYERKYREIKQGKKAYDNEDDFTFQVK